jgi:hypothetical protein
MAHPDPRSKAESADSSPRPRSTAQQVEYWLTLASLGFAAAVIGACWIASGIAVTASTAFLFLFATIGVWVTVYRLLILGIKQLVRGRIERSRTGRG